MKHVFRTAIAATVLVASTLQAQGPAGTFGPLAEATFGGSGIPNDAVMIGGFDGVVLGMTAHQRFSSPALTNNGAGVFYAQTGESSPGLSLWNFGFHVAGSTRDSYTYRILYDLNPAMGNSGHGELTAGFVAIQGFQGSENLGFGYLAGDIPGFVTAPSYTTFDPNVNGSYTFALQQLDVQGALVAQVGMEVIVGSPISVPEPASAALLLLGMAGLVAVRSRSTAGARTR